MSAPAQNEPSPAESDSGAIADDVGAKVEPDKSGGAPPPCPPATVFITGEVTIAHDILHPSGDSGKHVSYAPSQAVEIYKQSGGAWHHSELLKALLGDAAVKGRSFAAEASPARPTDTDDEKEAEANRAGRVRADLINATPQAHTLWVPFDRTLDKKDGRTFRVQEYLGTRRPHAADDDKLAQAHNDEELQQASVLLVIDEGYGQLKPPPPPPDGGSPPKRPAGAWLVHKSWLSADSEARPQLTTAMADHQGANPQPTAAAWHKWTGASRSVAVVSIGALRGLQRRVGTHQSWQRTVREVQAAVAAAEELRSYPYVVVVCGCAGVLVLEATKSSDGRSVEFDGIAVLHRGELEGEFEERHPGKVVGYGTCVTAHIVASLAWWVGQNRAGDGQEPSKAPLGKVSCVADDEASKSKEDVEESWTGAQRRTVAEALVSGARRGLIAARLLHVSGYLHVHNMPTKAPTTEKKVEATKPKPTPWSAWDQAELDQVAGDTGRKVRKERAALLKGWTEQFKVVAAQSEGLGVNEDDHGRLNPTTWAVRHWNTPAAAELKVADGIEVVPLYKISLPQREDQTKALASSLVTQGFKALAGNHPIPYATFGKLKEYDPDQIDTLCTLRRLLAHHRAGHAKKPLSMAVFGPPGAGKSFTVKAIAEAQGWSEDKRNILEFNLSQLPSAEALFDALHQVASAGVKEPPLVFFDEFDTSLGGQRLGWLRYFLAPMQDGAFSVGTQTYQLGRPVLVFAGGTAASAKAFGHAPQMSDIDLRAAKLPDFLSRLRATLDIPSVNPATSDGRGLHHLRRALIVRQTLANLAPQLCPDDTMKIEKGVLDALLCAPSYLHGARSIEAILTNSHLKGAQRFTASLLPPRHLLELHTDAGAFMQLVERTQ